MVDLELLEYSEGRHLCSVCQYCPDGYGINSTLTPHPCRKIDPEDNFYKTVRTVDNGGGYFVVECPEYKRSFIKPDVYFKSELWQKKRAERLRIDGFVCQNCGSAINLNVHHITYEHLPFEPMSDLITLCQKCHEYKHQVDICAKKSKQQNQNVESQLSRFNKIVQYESEWQSGKLDAKAIAKLCKIKHVTYVYDVFHALEDRRLNKPYRFHGRPVLRSWADDYVSRERLEAQP